MTGVREPEVSVVIGVRDAAARVLRTLYSVLAQRGVDLECLVVDDGSRDATVQRVARVAREDPRVRLLRQSPAGLTRALINGCAEARAGLIARIDAGDQMLPGRLARQRDLLARNPGVHVLATAARLCGPRGELLDEPACPGEPVLTDLTAGFRGASPRGLSGVSHMTVCMRRDAYRGAGGYRGAFLLAQDTDLWSRMAERGCIARLEQVLTEVRVALDGLSPTHHAAQLQLRELAAAAARARRDGGDERALLAQAQRLSRQALAGGGRRAGPAYFVASCLARSGKLREAEHYYRLALRQDPLAVRALLARARLRVRRLMARGAPWR